METYADLDLSGFKPVPSDDLTMTIDGGVMSFSSACHIRFPVAEADIHLDTEEAKIYVNCRQKWARGISCWNVRWSDMGALEELSMILVPAIRRAIDLQGGKCRWAGEITDDGGICFNLGDDVFGDVA